MIDSLDQAKTSRCYAADTCTFDDSCPFIVSCRAAAIPGLAVARGEEQLLIPHDHALHVAPEYAQVFADLGYGHLLHPCPEGSHDDGESS